MNYRYISEIKVDIENISKLHIGTGEERILLDDEREKAYMPATSIAGTFRSYLEQNDGKDSIKRLFGYQEKDRNYKSKVFISDAFANLKENSICIMPSIKIDSKTGASEKHSKFEREYLNEGHKFELKLKIISSEEDKKLNLEMIYKCLKALDNGEILIGGYTTYGAGQFKVKEAKQREYDLYNVDDFIRYLKKENLKYNNILEDIKKTDITNNFVEFEVNAKIEDPMLIGGQNQNDYEKPDKENIKDSNGNYIIPGSSLKGVFRQRARKILYYLNKRELLEYIFGTEFNESNNEDMERSRVFLKME
ncbi:MAG: RAMP superfamily CRISPR-associated protein [Clostridium cochlearium]|uniref:RAMP superfamily CRISPR-associated protein n=1 Tax=Clostridium cochlearium TaxID=1494 RepID=UPI00280A5266|nr:RAMP superfamily CRISPR-associated protein [Clostridium cochlearium]MDU1443556.1 RAMP superfamily CRISPR-associated protein [Clostridium cochlearium]